MTVSGVPDGYRTLSPYLLVENAEGLLSFVTAVFDTEVRRRMTGEAGGLHAELDLGDSALMVGEGGGERFPAMLHVYVEDADEVYARALAGGAPRPPSRTTRASATTVRRSTTAGATSGGSPRGVPDV